MERDGGRGGGRIRGRWRSGAEAEGGGAGTPGEGRDLFFSSSLCSRFFFFSTNRQMVALIFSQTTFVVGFVN